MEEVLHLRGVIVPQKRGVVDEAVFLNVLRVSSTLEIANRIVIFSKVKLGNVPCPFINLSRPSEDGFGKRSTRKQFFLQDEGDKKGFVIDDNGSAAAIPFDEGDGVLIDVPF